MTPNPLPPDSSELNRLLIELRMRMDFGVYLADRDVDGRDLRLSMSLPLLLHSRTRSVASQLPRELTRQQQRETLDEFVVNITGNLMVRWRQGDLYGLAVSFLDNQFQGQLTAYRRDLAAAQAGAEAPAPDPPGGLDSEEHETLAECHDLVRERLASQPAHLRTFDEWVRTAGRWGWLLPFVRQLASGLPQQELNRLYRRVRNDWLPYLSAFVARGCQDFVELCRPQWAELAEVDRAGHLICLMHTEGLGAAGTQADVPLAPPTNAPEEMSDPDAARFAWLRQRQRAGMRACAAREPRLTLLLDLYASGMGREDILAEVYEDSEAVAALETDLDRLHGWYVEVTQDALLGLDAWRFYDSIQRRIGVPSLRDFLHSRPEFEAELHPLIEAAHQRIAFLALTERLGMARAEVQQRLLDMRHLWNQRQLALRCYNSLSNISESSLTEYLRGQADVDTALAPVIKAANQPVSFRELPGLLGASWEEVIGRLLRIRCLWVPHQTRPGQSRANLEQ